MNLLKDIPLISIITVVYNARATLETTILSVLQQQRDLFEYWIIDGGSTDGSLEIIQKYSSELGGWISESDKGIYDAMNKGIDRARGQWLYFLGADDQLSKDIISNITPYLDFSLAAVYGNIVYDTGYGMRSHIGIWSILENTLHHQSAFYNHKLFEKFRYDTQYRINADYELTLLLYLKKHLTRNIPYLIAICGSKGASSKLCSSETNHLRGHYIKNVALNKFLSHVLDSYYLYHTTKGRIKLKAVNILEYTNKFLFSSKYEKK